MPNSSSAENHFATICLPLWRPWQRFYLEVRCTSWWLKSFLREGMADGCQIPGKSPESSLCSQKECAGQVPLPCGMLNSLFVVDSLRLDLFCLKARQAFLVYVPSRNSARSSSLLEWGMVSITGRTVCLTGGAINLSCNIQHWGCNSLSLYQSITKALMLS